MKKKALPFVFSLLMLMSFTVGSFGQNRHDKSARNNRESKGVGLVGTVLSTDAEYFTTGAAMDVVFTVVYDWDQSEDYVIGVEIVFPSGESIVVNAGNCSNRITDFDFPTTAYLTKEDFPNDYTALYEDSDGTFGIADSEPFTINITIPAEYSENELEIAWTCTGAAKSSVNGTITLEKESSLDDPTSVAASAASTSSIGLSWVKNGDNDVMVAYNTTNTFGIPSGTYAIGDEIDGGGTVIYNGSGTSTNHTGLTSGTEYFYKVFSVSTAKATSYSNGVEVSAMPAVELPLSEGFENGGLMPDGWTLETGAGASPWVISNGAEKTGNFGISVTQENAIPKDAWFFSQPIYMDAGTYILDFWYRADGINTEELSVSFGTEAVSSEMTGAILSGFTFSTNDYSFKHVSIIIPSNGIYYIGFHAESITPQKYIHIDDIEISEGTVGLWTGNEDTDWAKTSNWDNLAVPGGSDNVTIPDVSAAGLSGRFPVITDATAAICNNLTIAANAVLTVQSGGTLSIGGDLLLESIHSFGTTKVGSLVDQTNGGVTNTITGTNTVKLEMLGAAVPLNNQWHLISSPVGSFNSSDVFWNCFLRTFDESTGAYVNVGEDLAVDTDMEGYATMYYYGTGAANTKMLEFSGTLNTGNKSITCTKTGGQSGWNLVGNPYPSAVDWNLVTQDAYPDGLDNTLYVVDGDNVNSYKPATPPVGNPSSIIPAMQGFFVKCLTNNTDLTFKNNYRVSNQATFLKSDFDMHNVLAFVAENGDGLKDYMNVYFRDNATNGFDYDWDITKFFNWNESAPQVYVIEDGAYFTNNAYNSQNKPESVQIGFYSGTDGVYKIGLKGTEEIDADIALYLYDTKENIHVDLREIDQYEFNYSVNDDPARFKLQMNTTGIEDQDYFPFNVWLNGNQLMVNTGDVMVENIRLYDLSGKLLKEVANSQSQTTIKLPEVKSVYIIQMVTMEGVYSKKIVY